MEQFYSRQFQDREDGLLRLRNFLKEHEVEEETPCNEHAASPNKVARSAALLLHRAVRDAVYSVFGQATETVRVLFLEYVPGRVSPSEVARCVDRLLPELLAKSGDPSARLHPCPAHDPEYSRLSGGGRAALGCPGPVAQRRLRHPPASGHESSPDAGATGAYPGNQHG